MSTPISSTSSSAATTLTALIHEALQQPSTQQVIEYQGQWWSWGDVRRIADQVSALIAASGAGPSPAVAFVARNQPSALAAFLGLLSQQCSVRMVYPFQSPTALAGEIQRIAPALLVAAEEDCSSAVLAALAEHGGAAIALQPSDALACPGFEQARHRPATTEPKIEILTSGTTGPPKPFAIGYDRVIDHILGASAAFIGQKIAQDQQPPALAMFPLSNISGLYSTLPPLLGGQQIVMLERFTVAGWHDFIVRHKPPFSGMPPAGVQMVLDANIAVDDLACLQGLGTGAAPLDPAVQRAFEKRYGIPILLSYGATEFCGPVAAMTRELHARYGEDKFGSVGRAMPGMALRVVDGDSGEVLPNGEQGVLEVLCPRVGTEWLRTADIAVIDDDGFLFLHGRADCAIMRGGFKLLPTTIEQALLRHPAVAVATVVGIADHRLGQVPAAAIQLKPASGDVTAKELEHHLRQHLPATHLPVAWRFVDSLPRTPSMKVDLPAVAQLFDEHTG